MRSITAFRVLLVAITLSFNISGCGDGLISGGVEPPVWEDTDTPIDDMEAPDRPRGGLDERCDVGKTCDDGLICVGDVCKDDPASKDDGTDDTDDPAIDKRPFDPSDDPEIPEISYRPTGRDKFMSCGGHLNCASGLMCIGGICQDPEAVRMRREGESCAGHGDCASGLKCISGLCLDPDVMSMDR